MLLPGLRRRSGAEDLLADSVIPVKEQDDLGRKGGGEDVFGLCVHVLR